MLGMVVPIRAHYDAQLETWISTSNSPLLSSMTSQGILGGQLRNRDSEGRAQAATANTTWRGKGGLWNREYERVTELNIAQPYRYELTYRHAGAPRCQLGIRSRGTRHALSEGDEGHGYAQKIGQGYFKILAYAWYITYDMEYTLKAT